MKKMVYAWTLAALTFATLEVTFDISCSEADCGGMLAANPCTSVQSFNVFFDG